MVELDYLGHRKRLKDRFLIGGAVSMPDYEMLELLLMIAIPRRDVKPIAKELLKEFGNFAEVINAPVEELMKVAGVKENSATAIKIVKEAAIRMSWQMLQGKKEVVISGWDDLIDYCRMTMGYLDVEELRVLYLDAKFKLISEEIHQRGTVDQVAVHPREVVKSAMKKAAKAMIMVHNHPSGDVNPSRVDIEITKKVNEACNSMDIILIDHIIISKSDYYSFKEHGVI